MSEVLVTGASGFIGSHLAERLVHSGHEVRALVHYRGDGSRGWLDSSPVAADMEIVAGDVRDRDCVRAAMKGCEVVYHLAALIGIPYSYVAVSSYVETNIGGTLNMLQAARELGVRRVVHTSTSEVYGTAQVPFMDELHPVCPQSPYAASKSAADGLAESFYRSFGLPVVTVRPFNTFGPRQSTRAIIPTIISQCLEGGNCVRLGNTQAIRDLNYVDNTVDAFVLAGSAPGIEGRTINVGSRRDTSIAQLAALIGHLMGGNLRIIEETERLRPPNSEVDRLCCDSSLARKLLGWEPRVSLEDGLERTIDWMRENVGRYRAYEYAV